MSCVIIKVAFGYFLGHQPILSAELMAVCEGLDLAIKPVYSVLEVEFDLETAVSWITFWPSPY